MRDEDHQVTASPLAEAENHSTLAVAAANVEPSSAAITTQSPQAATLLQASPPTMSDNRVVSYFRSQQKGKKVSVESLVSQLVRTSSPGVWSKRIWKKFIRDMRDRTLLAERNHLLSVLEAFQSAGWNMQFSVGLKMIVQLARKSAR